MFRCPEPECDGTTFRLEGAVVIDVICSVDVMPDGSVIFEPTYTGALPDDPDQYDDPITCLTCQTPCTQGQAMDAYDEWYDGQPVIDPKQLPLLT